MTERRLRLEEAKKDARTMTSPPSSLKVRAAMAIALSKSSSPRIRAAAEWLAGKNTAEVRKRYGDAIEAAIGKASVSRKREMVDASDGAGDLDKIGQEDVTRHIERNARDGSAYCGKALLRHRG